MVKGTELKPLANALFSSHFYLLYTVLLSVSKGCGVPAKRTKCAPFKTSLPLCETVNLPENGTTQQDVDPGIEDLVTGCHSDTRHHEDPVIVDVSARVSVFGVCR